MEGAISPSTAIAAVKAHGEAGSVEVVNKAVSRANEKGKKKASGSLVKDKDIIRPIENFAGKLPVEEADRQEKILDLCSRLRVLVVKQ